MQQALWPSGVVAVIRASPSPTATTPDGHSACCNVYCGTQVAIQEQIEADEAKIALGVLGGFAVLVTVLALAVSGS